MKKISRSGENLWKSGLEFNKQSKRNMSRSVEPVPTSDPLSTILAARSLALEVENTLMWDIQLGIYAVRWDPTNVEKYKRLLQSLESFQKLVEQLQNKVDQISEEEYLNFESGIPRFRDGFFH